MDTLYSIETPEGVLLNLKLAGPVVRSGAWLIDIGIRSVFYIPAFLVTFIGGKTGMGLFMIALFLMEWFYPVVFELLWGATPGKRALGLKVVHSNGTPVCWQASVMRNLLRAADFLPLFYMFGLTSMLCNPRFQRLGDLAAGTLVVHHHKLSNSATSTDATPLRPPVMLNLQQRQAILSFAERYHSLSQQRAEELAGYLSAWQPDSQLDVVSQVLGYAHWYSESGAKHDSGQAS